MLGVYIPNFGKNLSKSFSFAGPIPYCCTNEGEIWHGGVGPLLRAKFHPYRCNVSPRAGQEI